MSLYSSYYPAGAQFDDNAPWEPDYVERPIEVEPFVSSHHFPTMPDTPESRAWKKRLADSCTKEII